MVVTVIVRIVTALGRVITEVKELTGTTKNCAAKSADISVHG